MERYAYIYLSIYLYLSICVYLFIFIWLTLRPRGGLSAEKPAPAPSLRTWRVNPSRGQRPAGARFVYLSRHCGMHQLATSASSFSV